MNKKLKKYFLEHCPNIPLLRNIIAKYKRYRYSRWILNEKIVERVENGEILKQDIVKKSSSKWTEISSIDNKTIDFIIKNAPECKKMSIEQQEKMRIDMLFYRFAYGFMPHEYISFNLSDKTPEERKKFVSESDHMRFVYAINDPIDIMIFNNKIKTYEYFGEYYRRDIISIVSSRDYSKYEDYIKKHPVFVKKQVYESCGKSIERIDIRTCGKSVRELFDEFLTQEKVILEEVVHQGEVTAVFNSSSVNTIRCITFNTKQGILIPYCFMKIGRAGSFVDNGGAGGILVGIDEKSGITNSAGVDELRNIYELHPDSGVAFRGHQLPEWNKLLNLCKKLSAMVPSVPYIGWDFAYTDKNEWVIIEGNGMSQFIGPQTIWQRGIKSEVEQYIREI